jgi:hypothetical protein
MHQIGYHEETVHETNEAVDYYNSKFEALGERFYSELLSSIDIVREAPHIWPKVENGASRFLLKHFPYALFYTYSETTVIIFAVANLNKKPMYWQPRLGS